MYYNFYSDDYKDLKYQFEIYSLPTIVILKDHSFRIHEGSFTVTELKDFIENEDKIWDETILKPAKGIFGRTMFSISENIESFIKSMDQLGLESLPKYLKLLIIGLFLLSPIIVVLFCIWTTGEGSEESSPFKKSSKKEQKKEDNKEDIKGEEIKHEKVE